MASLIRRVPLLLAAFPAACLYAGGHIVVDPQPNNDQNCVKPGAFQTMNARWVRDVGDTSGGSPHDFSWSGSTEKYTVEPSSGTSTTIKLWRTDPGGTTTVKADATWIFTWTDSKGVTHNENKDGKDSKPATIKPYARPGTPVPVGDGVILALLSAAAGNIPTDNDQNVFEYGAKYTSSEDECAAKYSAAGSVSFSGEIYAYANVPPVPWFMFGVNPIALALAKAGGGFAGVSPSPSELRAQSGYFSPGSVNWDVSLSGIGGSGSSGGDYTPAQEKEEGITGVGMLDLADKHAERTALSATKSGSANTGAYIYKSGDGAYAVATCNLIVTGAAPVLTFEPDYASCP